MTGKTRLIYIAPKFDSAWAIFEEIAKREGKSISELLNEQVQTYAKKHGSGNPAFSLDKFQDPAFVALPTLGETDPKDKVSKYDAADLKTIKFNAQSWAHWADKELEKRAHTPKSKPTN